RLHLYRLREREERRANAGNSRIAAEQRSGDGVANRRRAAAADHQAASPEMVGKTVNAITTHVLDTSRGLPAAGIRVSLEVRFPDGTWKPLGKGVTDVDGRAKDLLPNDVKLTEGV